MRNALVAETMPGDRLMAAMGVARTTSDSARIVGSLVGAALFALLGMGLAYLVVAGFYAGGFLLTLGVGAPAAGPASSGCACRSGATCVRAWPISATPRSLAAMWLAFLVNMTAFPMTSGLLPYVARDIYHIGQTGLGTLVASFAFGAPDRLAGRRPGRPHAAAGAHDDGLRRGMVHAAAGVRAHARSTSGRIMLVLAGFAQSLSMVPMAVMLLHSAGERFRGRVMGVRMLAIYGVPRRAARRRRADRADRLCRHRSVYCLVGLAVTALIAVRWRTALWPLDAPANAR